MIRGWQLWFVLAFLSAGQAMAVSSRASLVDFFHAQHNFSYSLGVFDAAWRVSDFGTTGSRGNTGGIFAKATYSYHLAIYSGLGALLGSSVGVSRESASDELGLDPGSSVHFPGLLAGVVLHPMSSFRLMFALDTYLERMNNIRSGVENENRLSIHLLSYDFMLILDLFYSLNWALRVESHFRWTNFVNPERAGNRLVGASLARSDRSIAIGFAYHWL